jgi:Tc5 transposase DNA-binding domain/CENP-B N-terminal DNA-binding domain
MESDTKRKRVTLTLQQKLDIVLKLEKGEKPNVIADLYRIGVSTVYDIKEQSSQLKTFSENSESSKALESRSKLRKIDFESFDQVLYDWFCLKRTAGVSITGPLIQEKAKELSLKMNCNSECQFSDGWLRSLKFVMAFVNLQHMVNKSQLMQKLRKNFLTSLKK